MLRKGQVEIRRTLFDLFSESFKIPNKNTFVLNTFMFLYSIMSALWRLQEESKTRPPYCGVT